MGCVKSCLPCFKEEKQLIKHDTDEGNSLIQKGNDDVLNLSRTDLLDTNDGPEESRPKAVGRSKTIQNAIDMVDKLDSGSEDEDDTRPSSSASSLVASECLEKTNEEQHESTEPKQPEKKPPLEATSSVDSAYDLPKPSEQAKQQTEDPYDLPRERIDSDYDDLPPRKPNLTRTLSEDDDYDELPVRRTPPLKQDNDNNNNAEGEDDDYDELPTKNNRKLSEDDYDELPPAKNRLQSTDSANDYDVPKEWKQSK